MDGMTRVFFWKMRASPHVAQLYVLFGMADDVRTLFLYLK